MVTQPLMVSPVTRVVVAAALLGGLLIGCKESLGERCEITNDCESGLICMMNTATNNGTCINPNSTVVPDAAATVDSAPVTTTPDAPVTGDAAAADAHESDGAAVDARGDAPADRGSDGSTAVDARD